jgi:CRP-like cAMP-binding protein
MLHFCEGRLVGAGGLDARNAQHFIAPSPFAHETAALAAPPPVGSRQLDPREKLFAQGDDAEQVFDVVEGSVMILRELSRGQRQIVDIAGPGRVVGFCAGERHDCTAYFDH